MVLEGGDIVNFRNAIPSPASNRRTLTEIWTWYLVNNNKEYYDYAEYFKFLG
jgi:hypothetical protein